MITQYTLRITTWNTLAGHDARNLVLAVSLPFVVSFIIPSVVQSAELTQPPFAYHVSLAGSNGNTGSQQAPWRTLAHARDFLRDSKGTMTHDITVYVRGGYHLLDQTLHFDDRDSGNNGFWVHFKAAAGERPVLSGGRRVTGWESGPNGIWSAPFDHQEKVRDLWVNGKRMRMAGMGIMEAQKIQGRGGWGSYEGTGVPTGIRFRKADIPFLQNAVDVELVTNRRWTYHILGVGEIFTNPSASTEWVYQMQEPYFHFAQTTLWPEHHPHGGRSFWIVNARELLDEPGEFYFDRTARRLFYMPHPDEDLTTAEVIVPLTQRLVRIEGRSMAQKVRNVRFSGLTFRHDAWSLDQIGNSRGASSNQGPKLIRFKNTSTDAEGDALLPAAVEVIAAEEIHFYRNVFEKLGGGGLNLINGVNHAVVEGNIFRDVGASAIVVSHPDLRDTSVLAGFDEEETCKYNVIRNNLIRSTGLNFWAAPAVIGFFPSQMDLAHNDIADSSYSGISLGWVWNSWFESPCTGNTIRNNRIFDSCTRLWDGGGIYLLGRQPGTRILRNHIGGSVNFGAIYADQGTRWLDEVNDNVTAISSSANFFYAHHSSTRDFSVRNTWTTSPQFTNASHNVTVGPTHAFDVSSIPAQAAMIIEEAGLQPAFIDLHNDLALPAVPAWPVPSGYQQWAAGKFGVEVAGDQNLRSGIWGPQAKADTSSMPNLLLYGTGMASDAVLKPEMQDGNLFFKFSRDTSQQEVEVFAEYSENLVSWRDAAKWTHHTHNSGDVKHYEVRLPMNEEPGFVRVKARWLP